MPAKLEFPNLGNFAGHAQVIPRKEAGARKRDRRIARAVRRAWYNAAMLRSFVAGPFAVAFALIVAGCQSQIPHGQGPVALEANVQLAFQRHLEHERPMVFLVGADGASAYAMYCPHLECEPDPLYVLAHMRCEERLGRPCRVFAELGRITWRGPVGYRAVGTGQGAVAGAAVDWGGSDRKLHNLKIDGLAAGPGTVAGKIGEAACAGAVDARAKTWRLDCGGEMRAHGALSSAGPGTWRGFGWSADRLPVRLFVTADVALGRASAEAGAARFPDQPPTYEEPGQMAIKGGDRISLFFRRR